MKQLKIIIIISLIISLIPIGINFYIVDEYKKDIFMEQEVKEKYDIALVLGCSVLKDGRPSKMLRDRLDAAISLYEKGLVKKILISGDHTKTYSEITTMNTYLKENDILEENILIDYEGYSTHESLINYQKNYKDESVIIVTQKYHLYRALFISQELDINAIGVMAKLVNYNGTLYREIREILARNKDFLLFKLFY